MNTFPVLTTQQMIVDSKRGDILKTTNIVANSLSSLKSLDIEQVNSVMEILDVYDGTRLIVSNTDGLVIYDNNQQSSTVGKYMLFSEGYRALMGYDVFRCEYSKGAFISTAAVPIVYSSQALGIVYMYEYDAEQAQLLLNMQFYLRTTSIVVSFIAVTIALAFSLLLRRRVARLITAMGRIREGEYSYRAEVGGRDELSTLAVEFNDLTDRLQKTEDGRRQFVSNASHELKTPLASIKLLADSVVQNENMSIEEVQEFLGDISQEITRLTRITERLLLLTRSDVKVQTSLTRVDMSYIVDRASYMLEPMAEHLDIDVRCELSDGCIVLAEEDGIYQAVFNLMENALKYNVKGGSVVVYTYIKDDKVYCIVDDTGIGMPHGELEKVFERFYRVDKARSRETGGTGLGLSIVKTTVEQFGGTVWAENRHPCGSRFTIAFPIFSGETEGEVET
ncbi:MAG: HAMP domain-containing histidine kinase [Clostridiales bacterium]|nr:HAMP domain-containing histidine kinase [Clostridiales bacterium]